MQNLINNEMIIQFEKIFKKRNEIYILIYFQKIPYLLNNEDKKYNFSKYLTIYIFSKSHIYISNEIKIIDSFQIKIDEKKVLNLYL